MTDEQLIRALAKAAQMARTADAKISLQGYVREIASAAGVKLNDPDRIIINGEEYIIRRDCGLPDRLCHSETRHEVVLPAPKQIGGQ